MVFGGNTLTATDIAVAGGGAVVGDPALIADLDPAVVATAKAQMSHMLNLAIDQTKPSRAALPVVLVGGGAILVTEPLAAASQVIQPKHAEVANAIGAAIAQIGGESERLVAYDQMPREQALHAVTEEAMAVAEQAGASRDRMRVADIEETAISYMSGNSVRLRVKVVGDIAALADEPGRTT